MWGVDSLNALGLFCDDFFYFEYSLSAELECG